MGNILTTKIFAISYILGENYNDMFSYFHAGIKIENFHFSSKIYIKGSNLYL